MPLASPFASAIPPIAKTKDRYIVPRHGKKITHACRKETLGLSLVVALFCLFQALPRWSPTDGLSTSRTQHTAAPSSLDTALDSGYRVGADTYTFFNIEDIRAGQLVLASNPATGQLEPRRVLQTFRRTTYHLRYLTFQSPTGARQTFETTDEHPFWSHGAARWIPAGDLEPGDRVIDPHGAQSQLISTRREPHLEGIPVFNFEVEGFHSYFVAAKGPSGEPVLVHNAGCGNNSTPVKFKGDRVYALLPNKRGGNYRSWFRMNGTPKPASQRNSLVTSIPTTGRKSNRISRRGWSRQTIGQTVNRPFKARSAVNRANGNPATAYFNADGSHVIRDNITGELIQLSNRLSPDTWIPDRSIIRPSIPPWRF